MTKETREEIIKDNIDRNIYNINRQIQILKIQKEDYLKRLNSLNKIEIFTKNEVKQIIEYLVSNIEDEKYILKKFHVNTKSSSYHIKNMISQYTFLYLTKTNNIKESEQEIKNKYNIKKINDDYYIKNIDDMRKTDINDNYVRLSLYNRYSDHEVKFNSLKQNEIISINIEDERYNYINEFIKVLLDKKLNKKDFKLSDKEVILFADDFILEYKNNKKLTKDIK